MKLANVGEKVVRIGHQTEREFKIKATAKAFRILSSGLYKDKVGAILRELSANAYDAHIACGNQHRPFVVHLPNMMEPFLSIRDFGPGLSHESIMDLYTTYFESTKADSNDYIGAMGLGSKSPFSYVKSFTVISRFEGVQRTYDAFIDEGGMPSIALRHEMISSEETGLEVVVPVAKRQDFVEFAQKASTTYKYYTVKPVIVGNTDIPLVSITTSIEGKGWRLRDEGYSYYNTGSAIAVMGIVGYPINVDEIENRADYDVLLRCPIDIEFPLGDLDITAGREELSYDPQTIKVIRARLKEVYDEIRASVKERFKACKTVLEGRILYGKIVNSDSLGRIVGSNLSVIINGVAINKAHFDLTLSDYPNTTFRHYNTSYRGNVRTMDSYKYNPDKKAYENRHPGIAAIEKVRVLIDDMEGKGGTRVISARLDAPDVDIWTIQTTSAQEEAALRIALDGFGFEKVSELPKAPASQARRAKASMRKLGLSQAKVSDPIPTLHYDAWKEVMVDVDAGGVYIMTKHSKFQTGDGRDPKAVSSDAVDEFSATFVALRKLNLFDPEKTTVYAVPATTAGEIIKSEKWVDFWTWAKGLVTEYLAREDSRIQDVSLKTEIDKLKEDSQSFRELGEGEIRTISGHLPRDHRLRKFIDILRRVSYTTDSDHIGTMIKALGINVGAKKQNVKEKWSDIEGRYPLLPYLCIGYYTRHRPKTSVIVDYINSMDKLSGGETQ